MSGQPRGAFGWHLYTGQSSSTDDTEMSLAIESITVLHVDADTEFAALTKRGLERADERIEVRSESTPDAALDRLDTMAVDCVVSEYEMPGMDGLEFLTAVRDECSELPFILFTGRGSETIASEAISAGVTDYLQKSGGTEQYDLLANRIGTAVEVARSRSALEEHNRQLETLIENLPGMVYRCENAPDWPMEFVGGECEELTGYDPSALEEGTVRWGEDVIDAEHQSRIWTAVQRAIDDREPFEVTYPIETSDGTTKWVFERGRGIDVDGEIEAIEGFMMDVSELKSRERTLERQKAAIERQRNRFSRLFESFPEPTVAYRYDDASPHVVFINEAFTDVFGYSNEEAAGEPIDELIVPPDLREQADRIDERVRAGDTVDRVLRRTAHDGMRAFRFRNVRLHDDEEIDGFAIYADVTEQKRRERQLHRNRELLRSAERLARTGGWELDTATDDLKWTEGTKRIHGVTETYEPTLQASLEFFHPEDRDTIEGAIEAAIEAGTPWDHEVRIRTTADKERWIRTTGERIESADGSTVLRGSIRDVTDQKRRQRELERYRTLVETIGDPMYVLDAEGTITMVNEAAVDTWGYAREELIGMHASEVMPEEDYDRGTERIVELLEDDTKRWGTFEMRSVTADSELIVNENKIAVLTDDDGSYVGSVGVIRDITDRKRYERELEAQNERLEQFASIVSHDLRNPLNIAAGRVRLARETADNEHLEVAERSLDRMEALIDDLLTLARHGTDVTNPEPVAFDDLVDGCWETVDTGNATLLVETDRTIDADVSQLKQLLENLIRNSVEHGGADVTITIGTFETGFYVEDDGDGLPEEKRDRIFESGYSTARDGTGFGLSIVQQVADAHGWTVRARNGSDGGARFEIDDVEFVD